jgi:hypothetical protein
MYPDARGRVGYTLASSIRPSMSPDRGGGLRLRSQRGLTGTGTGKYRYSHHASHIIVRSMQRAQQTTRPHLIHAHLHVEERDQLCCDACLSGLYLSV